MSTPEILQDAEPAWAVATLFPPQGRWTESDYFSLNSKRLIELANGTLEVLPMPTWLHQWILDYMSDQLKLQVRSKHGGTVLPAALPIRLFEGTIREPDLMYFAPGSEPADVRGYPDRVDLAVEVVSPDSESHKRDHVDKVHDYAKAGVPEYWIVDPQQITVTVMVLDDGADEYQRHGVFRRGETASGKLFPELAIDVTRLMAKV